MNEKMFIEILLVTFSILGAIGIIAILLLFARNLKLLLKERGFIKNVIAVVCEIVCLLVLGFIFHRGLISSRVPMAITGGACEHGTVLEKLEEAILVTGPMLGYLPFRFKYKIHLDVRIITNYL